MIDPEDRYQTQEWSDEYTEPSRDEDDVEEAFDNAFYLLTMSEIDDDEFDDMILEAMSQEYDDGW